MTLAEDRAAAAYLGCSVLELLAAPAELRNQALFAAVVEAEAESKGELGRKA